MTTRTYGEVDVSVDGDLIASNGFVAISQGQLTVKARDETRPGVWEPVLILTNAVNLADSAARYVWAGDDADGNRVRVYAVSRKPKCGPCGR